MCDGTADESEINTALTAIATLGGKVVLSEGTFTIAAPIAIANSNTSLEGMGYGTLIQLANAANCNMIEHTGTGTKLCQIGNFRLNGNKANQTTAGNGIYNDTPPDISNTDSMHLYHDMYILNCFNDVIQTKVDLVNYARVIKFERIRVEGSGDHGYNVSASDCMYMDCEAATSNKNGFFSRGGAAMFVNCKAFVNAQGTTATYAGFYFDGAGNQIVGCEAQDNKYNGIYLSQFTYNTVLVGCTSDGNGTSGTGAGLQITDSARASVSGGSYSNHADMANLQQYGIHLTGTTTGVIVSGVIMDANLTAPYLDSSSGVNMFLGYNPTTSLLEIKGTDLSIGANLIPITSDGGALGSATKMWSDLFLASGAVVNFNNGDVTLTHGSGILNFNGGDLAINGGTSLRLDNGSNNNNIFISNNGGSGAGFLYVSDFTGTLPIFLDGVVSTTGVVQPNVSDGAALGSTSKMWADLFLASGAVVNYNNGNVVLTHTTGVLTLGTGDLQITTAGTNAASAVTVGGSQNLTNKVLTAATVTTSLLPTTDDGAPLGSTSKEFSDLFLASGGVINWANGNVVLTHTSGVLTLGTGTLKITTPTNTTTSVVTIDGTQTLTNKRRTRRLVVVTQSATPAINTDNMDVVDIHSLAQAITSMTTNLSGSPLDGDLLEVRIQDDGTPRAITWGTQFFSTTVTLPTTTVASTMLRVGFEYNGYSNVYNCIAVA